MDTNGFTESALSTMIVTVFGRWHEVQWVTRGPRHVSRVARVRVGDATWHLYEKNGKVQDENGRFLGYHPDVPNRRMDTSRAKADRKRYAESACGSWPR